MHTSLYLASQSPRRLDLLRQIGLAPTVLLLRQSAGRLDVDETPRTEEPAAEYVLRLAHAKAIAGMQAQSARHLPTWPIVAADTTVTLDGRILGKPADADEARAMLHLYAGRTHSVLTGVAVAYQGRIDTRLSESQVRFREIREAEISAYIASGEPFDKAGGYAIQGRAAAFIEHLAGSYSGVMGLPLFETSELLNAMGVRTL